MNCKNKNCRKSLFAILGIVVVLSAAFVCGLWAGDSFNSTHLNNLRSNNKVNIIRAKNNNNFNHAKKQLSNDTKPYKVVSNNTKKLPNGATENIVISKSPDGTVKREVTINSKKR